MTGRSASAVTGVLLVVVTGCSQPEVRSQATATVSIDGKEQGQTLNLRCNQFQSSWFLDIADDKSTASAIVDVEGDKVAVQTVTIRGYGGFDGSYWKGGDNTVEATFTNRQFTISGTASGLTDNKPATARFKITARC